MNWKSKDWEQEAGLPQALGCAHLTSPPNSALLPEKAPAGSSTPQSSEFCLL